jgi:hypothetical protein
LEEVLCEIYKDRDRRNACWLKVKKIVRKTVTSFSLNIYFLFLIVYLDEVYETDHKGLPKTTKGVETFSMKGSPNVH